MSCISSENIERLEKEFGVSQAVFSEIQECLEDFLGAVFSVSIAPLNKAFESSNNSRGNIDIYEMNDEGRVGVECILWVDGVPTEAVLHVEMEEKNYVYNISYKYIGS
ncbi:MULTISPECIES: hypothetical protein [unclassified Pseudomonas]|uniref:hypothetical protein n=1 Tax=unclassified Pseudomonas TaxID=196821 RepID=UPI00244BA58F|nr:MULTISPECIES: hypothetical protein [unclassified Pseudomonas]MDG9931231.1 hypothetical protein [Pseudomonas sp. GD04042]MDH0483561.1 hypothetical protein [Pseudomonas sp. GD04015]MDH0606061.1 hypothetical protein [Pseudomonas sp. GD03869]